MIIVSRAQSPSYAGLGCTIVSPRKERTLRSIVSSARVSQEASLAESGGMNASITDRYYQVSVTEEGWNLSPALAGNRNPFDHVFLHQHVHQKHRRQ